MGTKPNIQWAPCGVGMLHAMYGDLLLFIRVRSGGAAQLIIEEEPGYGDACAHRNLPRRPESVNVETHVDERYDDAQEAKDAALEFVRIHRHWLRARINQRRSAQRRERGQYRIIVASGDYDMDTDVIGFWLGAAWSRYAADARHITLVHGNETQVERACVAFAKKLGWADQEHPLEFAKHLGNAYKMRDVSMLSRGGDVCLWFPGRYGTSHVAARAHKIGMPIMVVKP